MAAAAPQNAAAPQSSSSSSSSSHGLLRPGSTVSNGRVFIESGERLGHGTFSEIFLGTNLINKNRYALKVDKPGPRMALQWESDVLMKLQKYPFAARHYGLYTMPDKKLQVLAMQLLGNSISALRRKQPDSFMPFASVCHITLQMLAAIEGLHQEGYIHRDLKPSNFVHGLGKQGKKQIYVIDFGQSRQYIDESTGNVRPARPFADFRGTSLYSSLHAHQLKDLGRRDDLWALWYIFCELARGGLPWKCVKEDRYHCEIAKKWYVENPKELTLNLPGESHLLVWHSHLQSLTFEAKPDYAFVASCIRGALNDAVATKRALQRNFGAYRDNELFMTIFDETIYRHHSYYHYCASKAAETEKAAAKGSPGDGAARQSSSSSSSSSSSAAVVGHTTILFWNAELTTACHPSANTLQLLAAQDASGESVELVALFDQTEVPYSSDCVLECRGGVQHSWETDSEGTPIYIALKTNEQGDLTVESDAMVEALRSEKSTCQAVVDRYYETQLQIQQLQQQQQQSLSSSSASGSGIPSVPAGSLKLPAAVTVPPAIGAGTAAAFFHHNHHSTDMMGPGAAAAIGLGAGSTGSTGTAGDDSGLSPSAGRKRRRNGEVMVLEYSGRSDGYVVSDLTQRLTDLRGVLEKSVQDILAAAGTHPATATANTNAPSSSSGPTVSPPPALGGAAASTTATQAQVDPEIVARGLGTYLAAWRRLADAALQRFEQPCNAAKAVRADIVLLFKRILEATKSVPPVSFPSNVATNASAANGSAAAVLASAPASSSRLPASSKVSSFGDVSTASGSGASAATAATTVGVASSATPMTVLPAPGAPSSTSTSSSSSAAVTSLSVVAIANDILSSSGGALAVPFVGGNAGMGAGIGGDKNTLQMTLGRVEAWLQFNADKASAPISSPNGPTGIASAAALSARNNNNAMEECSSNGAPGSSSSASSENGGGSAASSSSSAAAASNGAAATAEATQANEEAAFKASEERLMILSCILRALERERDLMRAPIAPENWKSKSGFAPPQPAVLAYQQQVQNQRQHQQLHQQQYQQQQQQHQQQQAGGVSTAPPLIHLNSFTSGASVRYSSASSATGGTGAFMPGPFAPAGTGTSAAAPASGAPGGTSLFTPLSSAVSGLSVSGTTAAAGAVAGAGAAPAVAPASRRSNGGTAAKDDISGTDGGTSGGGAVPGTGGLGGSSTTSSSSNGAEAEPPAAKRTRINDGGSAAFSGSLASGPVRK